MPHRGQKGTYMSNAPAPEYSSQASEDFWAWMGPKVDAWDARNEADRLSAPERDEATRTILGEEMLDIEFEPVTQVAEREPVLSER